jgi:hypothetical protein
MDFKTAFLSMNPNITCLLLVMFMIGVNLIMYTLDKFSETMTDERLLKLEERLDKLTGQTSKQEDLPLIAPKIPLSPENTDTILKWYGLSEKDLGEVNKVDDSRMIDGVPVLGKGVYNRKNDHVQQLKGIDAYSYYD